MISNCESSETLRTRTGQSGLPPRGLPYIDHEKIAREGNYIHSVILNAVCTIQALFSMKHYIHFSIIAAVMLVMLVMLGML